MKRSNLVLIFLAATSVAMIFFVPQWAWRLKAALVGYSIEGENKLILENEVLKAELAKLQNIKSQLPEKPFSYIRGIVLSRYPMSFKNEFLVDTGANNGAREGVAVTFGGSATLTAGGVLIGRIEKVFNETSLVKTVFDSGFQMPVRVGTRAVNALFRGGLSPGIYLIPLDGEIKSGDIVYSSSPDFPYGLPVGNVKDIKISDDKLFREATLDFVYDLNGIGSVLINNVK